MRDKRHGVEAGSACLKIVRYTQERKGYSILDTHGHCCAQEHAGAGVVQMAGALLKMKAQAVLFHAVCNAWL